MFTNYLTLTLLDTICRKHYKMQPYEQTGSSEMVSPVRYQSMGVWG